MTHSSEELAPDLEVRAHQTSHPEVQDVEVGVVISSGRSLRAVLAAARHAEEERAHSVWIIEEPLEVAHDADLAPSLDGPVAATAALLATRRALVGLVVDVDSMPPVRVVNAVSSLVTLKPCRLTVALRGEADRVLAVESLLSQDIEVVNFDVVRSLSDEHNTRQPVYIPMVLHEDDELAASVAENGQAFEVVADRYRQFVSNGCDLRRDIIWGDPARVLEELAHVVKGGRRRLILDNILPIVLPDEISSAERALSSTLHKGRLQLAAAVETVTDTSGVTA